jgi:protein involved in polysaccharide export with SLBB domain
MRLRKIVLWGFMFIVACLCFAETDAQEIPVVVPAPVLPAVEEAQEAAPMGTQERPIVSDDYLVQPGDSLLVSVTGGASFAFPQLVTPEGKLVPLIPFTAGGISREVGVLPMGEESLVPLGEMRVSGHTLREVREELAGLYSRYLRGVECAVVLLKLRTFRVFVLGQVRRPGVYWATPVDRASEVIARGGGLAESGSPSQIQLQRLGKLAARVDLNRFQLRGDLTANPYVQDGDVLFVPPMASSVTVRGAVFGSGTYRLKTSALTAESERISEGTYELLEGEGVRAVVAKAGGVTPWASLRDAYVERTVSSTKVRVAKNLGKILAPGGEQNDAPLQNGDVLVVPGVPEQIYVRGAVTAPGAFPFQADRKIGTYLGLAGGPTNRALLSGAVVIRTDGSKVRASEDLVPDRGETIYVPEQSFKWWQDYLSVASVVSTLVISWYTLTK